MDNGNYNDNPQASAVVTVASTDTFYAGYSEEQHQTATTGPREVVDP